MRKFENFSDFYGYYLTQHSTCGCRLLHVVGLTFVLVIVALSLITSLWLLLFAPVVGYGFAWLGHASYEHNRPATFDAPFWSFLSDWRMYGEVLMGKLPLCPGKARRLKS